MSAEAWGSGDLSPDEQRDPVTTETWCPTCGDVTAELETDRFQCPVCGVTIPRRIIELGPRPEDRKQVKCNERTE